jgi:hypothetical protein
MEADLPCPIHDAHATARDFFEQLVIAEIAKGSIWDGRFWILDERMTFRLMRS